MNTSLIDFQGYLHKDALTGALTRKTFQKLFRHVLNRARASNEPFTLAYLDIDNFFNVNQTYGHVGGDHVLVSVADKARRVIGDKGEVIRYGGDEFIILLPGMGREGAFLTLERLREAVEAETTYGSGENAFQAQITISAGLASFPVDGRTEYELMRKADEALYRAKLDQRNTIRLAVEERMVTKTTHYTQTQLERLSRLANEQQVGEAELLREALDDLITKYDVKEIFSRDSEEILRCFIEQSMEGMFLTDERGGILIWNHQMETLSGLKAKSLLSKPIWEVFLSLLPQNQQTPKSAAAIRSLFQTMLESGSTPENLEPIEPILNQFQRQSGGVRCSLVAVETSRGAVIGGYLHTLAG